MLPAVRSVLCTTLTLCVMGMPVPRWAMWSLHSALHPHCIPSHVPQLALPLCQACAKSIVQNYVFKYLGFHQLCKLSPSIKVAGWLLCWGAELCHAPGSDPEGLWGWDSAWEWGRVAWSIPAGTETEDSASFLFPCLASWKLCSLWLHWRKSHGVGWGCEES